jgi:hypothetical protein
MPHAMHYLLPPIPLMNSHLSLPPSQPTSEHIQWLKNFRKKVGERHSHWAVDPMVAVAVEADATRLIDLLDSADGSSHAAEDDHEHPVSRPPRNFEAVASRDHDAFNRILSFISYLKSRSDFTPDMGRELGLADS